MKKQSKMLAIFLALGMILSGLGQGVVAEENPGAGPAPVGPVVTRLGGADRVETAILASREAYRNGANTVVLAGFNGEVDALTGTLLAAAKDAPLLVSRKDRLSQATKDEIARLEAETVYILGGETRISKEIETELKKTYSVKRISGKNRFETAVNIAKEVKGEKADHAFLALGWMPERRDALADALAIGPVSALERSPVLLTIKDSLAKESKASLEDLEVKYVTIVGESEAISDLVVAELEVMGIEVDRVGGSTREETALAIANRYFPEPSNLIVAYGRSTVDALVGGYFGYLKGGPILLTNDNGITEETKEYIRFNNLDTFVLGGTAVVGQATFNQIEESLKAVERELTITDYYGDKDVIIPSRIEGSQIIDNMYNGFLLEGTIGYDEVGIVTRIGDYAFKMDQLTQITSVIIPDSVTSIGSHAF